MSLMMVLALVVATPAAAFANEAPDFWADPLGAISAFFTGEEPAPLAAGDSQAVADEPTVNKWRDYAAYTTENIGRIWNDKSVFTDDVNLTSLDGAKTVTVNKGEDSDFLVGLSALSSVSNTTSTSTKPLDIVLVLDASGSMEDEIGSTTKMEALQASVNQFIDETEKMNSSISDPSQQHRISLVKFAGKKTDKIGNGTYWESFNRRYNYTQVITKLTPCTDVNANNAKAEVNSIKPAGATSADYGMQLVNNVLEEARPAAQKVVVFFTDGEPTHGSEFDRDVANGAIEAAKSMKAAGTLVYSIGVFEDADPADTSGRFNAYMHGVSSNFPEAESYRNLGDRAEGSDYYKAAKDSEELNQIFKDISGEISSGLQFPTHVEEGFGPTEGGYITFTDALGDYMKVDGFQSVVFAGNQFTNPTVSDDGNGTTTYTFEGKTDTPLYPEGDLNQMIIQVKQGDDLASGDVVTVKIPASLIPVRKFQVNLDAGTMDVSDTYPIRVFYNVSLKDGVAESLKAGGAIDPIKPADYEKLETYLQGNKVDGKAAFYSNKWTNKVTGDTIASFDPSPTNSFYYFTEDTPVYTDVACKNQATESDLASGASLYSKWEYFERQDNGTYKKVTASYELERIMELDQGYRGTDGEGHVYIKAGAPHLTRANDFFTPKDADGNHTGTASQVQRPEWNSYKTIESHLGNNGRLTLELPGSLSLTKQITVPSGFDSSKYQDAEFTFKITVEGANGSYRAEVKNGSGEVVSDSGFALIFTDGTASHSIKPNETLYIYGLDAGSNYSVEEIDLPAGFKQTEAEGDKGAIASGSTVIAKFTNAYGAEPTTQTAFFSGHKSIDHRDFKQGDSFTFEVAVQFEGSTELTQVPLPNKVERIGTENRGTLTVRPESGDIFDLDFGTLSYEVPGTYIYTISEQQGSASGITYSQAQYMVTVTVSDDGDGTMSTKVDARQITDDAGAALTDVTVESNVIDFTNVFRADEIMTSISARKDYTDNSGGNPLTADMFEFTLRPTGDNAAQAPMPAGAAGEGANRVSKAGNAQNGSVVFGGLTITQDMVGQTYSYEMVEVIPAGATDNGDGTKTLDGMTYDASVRTVTLAVEQDGDGAISATVSYGGDGTAVFKNSYDANEVVLEGNAAVGGTKVLTGRTMSDGEFQFKLVPTGDTIKAIDQGYVGGISAEGKTASATAGGSFAFDGISFSRAGTYTFDISEIMPDQPAGGITYDTHVCKVTVKVTLDRDAASLVADVDYGTDPGNSFANTYNASVDYGAAGGLTVVKTLNGRDMKMGEFSFTMKGVDAGDSVAADEADAKLGEDDRSFKNGEQRTDGVPIEMKKMRGMSFDQDDAGKTFSYEVSEVKGDSGGVTYDETTYTVSIEVIDNGDGTMHTLTTVKNGATGGTATFDSAAGQAPRVSFTNAYSANQVTGDKTMFEASKILDGRDSLDGEEFDFLLTPADLATRSAIDAGQIVLQKQDAKVSNLKDGVKQGFDFGTATFTEPGTYTFKVTEVVPDPQAGGMTYDDHEATVKIKVVDDGAGSLKIDSVENKGMDFVNEYEPGGTVDVTADSFKLTKRFTGRAWTDGYAFDFNLVATGGTDSHGSSIAPENVPMPADAKVTVAAPDEGSADTASFGFGPITYDSVGTYTYQVTETHGDNAGITYSTNVATVTVTVTDNLHGGLAASVSVANPEFVNVYNAGSVDYDAVVGLQIQKNLTGRPLYDGQFEFTLNAKNDDAQKILGSTSRTYLNGAADLGGESGNVATSFVPVKLGKVFTLEDAGKTYDFTVSETKGGADGYVNDPHVYQLSIEVIDQGDGTLVVKTFVDGKVVSEQHAVSTMAESGPVTLVFNNSYASSSEAVAGIKASKLLKNDTLVDGQFTFKVVDNQGDVVMEAANDAQGQIAFDDLHFDIDKLNADVKSGVATVSLHDDGTSTYAYTYTVTEDALDANSGVTVEKGSFTIRVEVVDNGAGELTATVVYPEGMDKLEFVNVYGSSASANVAVNGTKTLSVISGN
ncbi:MAG: FctA domain-containing protein, partial [Collinsella sp.]|nr:FctA domain-containing protein [Collinsella sp.]